jgi:hypothetical protein
MDKVDLVCMVDIKDMVDNMDMVDNLNMVDTNRHDYSTEVSWLL